MYADDTNVFFNYINIVSLEVKTNDYFAMLSTWLRESILQENPKKSTYHFNYTG